MRLGSNALLLVARICTPRVSGKLTSHGQRHSAELSRCIVQVQAVAFEQQVHSHIAEVVHGVPEVKGAILDPALASTATAQP